MTNRTTQRVIASGAAVVAVAAGWWQWREDGQAASAEERLEAITGVASVAYDPAHPYEVTLDPGLDTGRVSDVLAEASSILQSAGDPQAYPMMFVLTERDEFYVDLGGDADRTAAVIAATQAPSVVGADIDFDPDSLSRLTFEAYDDVLPGARQMLSDLDRAGIDDLRPIGGHLEFWFGETVRSVPALEIDSSLRVDAAVRELDRLVGVLSRSGATLIRADLGAGEQSIEVAVRQRSRVESVARLFTTTYGERSLDLTVTVSRTPVELLT